VVIWSSHENTSQPRFSPGDAPDCDLFFGLHEKYLQYVHEHGKNNDRMLLSFSYIGLIKNMNLALETQKAFIPKDIIIHKVIHDNFRAMRSSRLSGTNSYTIGTPFKVEQATNLKPKYFRFRLAQRP
jgi:hypothetical protein